VRKANCRPVHLAVNTWIRSSGAFDGVIDFDEVTKDPNRPTQKSDKAHLVPGAARLMPRVQFVMNQRGFAQLPEAMVRYRHSYLGA
jgi:hypothetical protein